MGSIFIATLIIIIYSFSNDHRIRNNLTPLIMKKSCDENKAIFAKKSTVFIRRTTM
jgi:hypothetical protein